MFPIPWNKLFRKKDGSITTLDDAISSGGGGGGGYTLPPATESTLGGIKVGSGLSVESDGTLSTSGGSGSGLSYVEYSLNKQIQGDSATYYDFNAPEGKAPISAVIILDESTASYNNPYLLMSLTKENKFGYTWYARIRVDEEGSVFNIKGKLRVYYINET